MPGGPVCTWFLSPQPQPGRVGSVAVDVVDDDVVEEVVDVELVVEDVVELVVEVVLDVLEVLLEVVLDEVVVLGEVDVVVLDEVVVLGEVDVVVLEVLDVVLDVPVVLVPVLLEVVLDVPVVLDDVSCWNFAGDAVAKPAPTVDAAANVAIISAAVTAGRKSFLSRPRLLISRARIASGSLRRVGHRVRRSRAAKMARLSRF